jgi:hypothetical protein
MGVGNDQNEEGVVEQPLEIEESLATNPTTAAPSPIYDDNDAKVEEEEEGVSKNAGSIYEEERSSEPEGIKPIPKEEEERRPEPMESEPSKTEYEEEQEDEEEVAQMEKKYEKEEEKLEEELVSKERRIGGFSFVLAMIAMIFTAQQMSENPDGIYAR